MILNQTAVPFHHHTFAESSSNRCDPLVSEPGWVDTLETSWSLAGGWRNYQLELEGRWTMADVRAESADRLIDWLMRFDNNGPSVGLMRRSLLGGDTNTCYYSTDLKKQFGELCLPILAVVNRKREILLTKMNREFVLNTITKVA